MSKRIKELIAKYIPLQEKIWKLEKKIYKYDCIYRKLVEAVSYDHSSYHICEEKTHVYSRSLVALCSLKYCPLKISKLQKDKGDRL